MTLSYAQAAAQAPTLLEAALRYAEGGWYVFALAPYDKLPRKGSHGHLDATLDADTIRAWWTSEPEANIGIDCGRSRLLVIDIDPRNGGDKTYTAWVQENSMHRVDTTWLVKTPAGGRHIYLSVGDGMMPRVSKLGVGVDLKADGGYVIAPPSRTVQGDYTWM
jgi:hypothetical protein